MLIDVAHLQAQTFDDADLQQDLLSLFVAQARGSLSDIDMVLARSDDAGAVDGMTALLHRLKGSALAIGATNLARQSQKVEDSLRDGSTGLDRQCSELRRLLDETVAEAAMLIDARAAAGLAKRQENS